MRADYNAPKITVKFNGLFSPYPYILACDFLVCFLYLGTIRVDKRPRTTPKNPHQLDELFHWKAFHQTSEGILKFLDWFLFKSIRVQGNSILKI